MEGAARIASNALSGALLRGAAALLHLGAALLLARLLGAAGYGDYAFAFAFALAIGAISWIASAPILSVFGSDFSESSQVLRILALGQMANAAAGPVAYLLLMTGHEKDAARGLALGAGVHIVLLAALVPYYGATGAAVATAASVLLWNAILAFSVRRRLGLGPVLLFA